MIAVHKWWDLRARQLKTPAFKKAYERSRRDARRYLGSTTLPFTLKLQHRRHGPKHGNS